MFSRPRRNKRPPVEISCDSIFALSWSQSRIWSSMKTERIFLDRFGRPLAFVAFCRRRRFGRVAFRRRRRLGLDEDDRVGDNRGLGNGRGSLARRGRRTGIGIALGATAGEDRREQGGCANGRERVDFHVGLPSSPNSTRSLWGRKKTSPLTLRRGSGLALFENQKRGALSRNLATNRSNRNCPDFYGTNCFAMQIEFFCLAAAPSASGSWPWLPTGDRGRDVGSCAVRRVEE